MRSHCYRDVKHENTLCVVEEWATQADVDAPLHTANRKVLRGAVGPPLAKTAEIKFHTVLQTRGEETILCRVSVLLREETRRHSRAGGNPERARQAYEGGDHSGLGALSQQGRRQGEPTTRDAWSVVCSGGSNEAAVTAPHDE